MTTEFSDQENENSPLKKRISHYGMIGLAFFITFGFCVFLPFFPLQTGPAVTPGEHGGYQENSVAANGHDGKFSEDLTSRGISSDAVSPYQNSDFLFSSDPSGKPSDADSGFASDPADSNCSGDNPSGDQASDGYSFPPLPADDGVTLQEGTAAEDYLEKIFFLGDSTTYGLRIYKILGKENAHRVWSPKSGTLALFNATREKLYDPESKSELSLSEMAKKYRPPYLVITLGVNGIAMMKESYFKSEYAKVISLVREASPDTKIILQSMYPVSSAYHETKSLNQEKIITGNLWIRDIAAENGCRFLNSFSCFLDEKGYMDLQYENGGDGMHFNAAGYRRMLEYLLAHPYPEAG